MNINYLKKAEENLPFINEKAIIPDISVKELNHQDTFVIDLENHYVGQFSFTMGYCDVYIDAPVKLAVRFCETECELYDDFSKYNGTLCSSWLQEEIINIDFPGEYKMPRRYAARYIKITVLAAQKKIALSGFKFNAVTSADENFLKNVKIKCDELQKIDTVSCNTLKNCMQRVFEDGPKRDRRLWTGDLRLEALTNYYTFNNLQLVKRCLYLFAAATPNGKGFIPGYIYENPEYVSGSWFLEDYALLFVASACDYYNHTHDKTTFLELYPAIKQQMQAAYNALDSDGIITIAEGCDAFIDWCEGLEKITSLQGVYLYVLNMLKDVLKNICHYDADLYSSRYTEALENSKKVLYNSTENNFINSKDGYQYSVHSAVWGVLGGIVTEDCGVRLLENALKSNDSMKPFTPYMHHYVVEAMLKLNMQYDAENYIKNYWGGMVKLGANTFFEVYVPGKPDFSPYNNRMINSMCHAWSCTPAYFIRRYFSEIRKEKEI